MSRCRTLSSVLHTFSKHLFEPCSEPFCEMCTYLVEEQIRELPAALTRLDAAVAWARHITGP